MARRKRAVEPLATIWNCPDALWDNIVVPTLHELDPEPHTGRPRVDQRRALDGIPGAPGRSGCQWNHLPKEFGDDASIHRTFQRWIERGVLERIWAKLVEMCDELGAVDWVWQSADAALGKARFGGIVSERIPRIERRTAASTAFSSKAMVGRSPPMSKPPMCMTR